MAGLATLPMSNQLPECGIDRYWLDTLWQLFEAASSIQQSGYNVGNLCVVLHEEVLHTLECHLNMEGHGQSACRAAVRTCDDTYLPRLIFCKDSIVMDEPKQQLHVLFLPGARD